MHNEEELRQDIMLYTDSLWRTIRQIKQNNNKKELSVKRDFFYQELLKYYMFYVQEHTHPHGHHILSAHEEWFVEEVLDLSRKIDLE